MKKGNFQATLDKIDRRLSTAKESVETIRILCEKGDMEEAYAETFRLEANTEKTVLLTRALPAYAGSPRSRVDVKLIMENTIRVEIGYTEEGWFSLRMPALLPKKNGGSADYIRQFLYPAMRRFFKNKVPFKPDKATIIYRHIYSEERPERQMRDHDNIEVNMVTDVVALFTLVDDSPAHCSHYYCSDEGSEERTEVYVVPDDEFAKWLEVKKTMPKEGVNLYEKRI